MASNRVIIVKTFERAEGALCVARELVIVFMIRIATVMHHDMRGRLSPSPHPSGGRGGIDYYPPTYRVHLLDNYNLVGYSAKTYER